MKTTALAIALAAGLTAGAAVPALAADQLPQATVSYADLDLTETADQNTFKHRLDKAARKVCAMDARTSGMRIASRESQECYAKATQRTREAYATILENGRLGG